jgi:HK97 family phage major capsid protein
MNRSLLALSAAIGPMTAMERAAGRYMRAPDHDTIERQSGAAGAVKAHLDAMEERFGPLPDQVREALFRMNEIEQKMARGGPSGPQREPSWGEQFVSAKEADLSRIAREKGRVSMEIKATVTSATADAAGSAGAAIVPQFDPAVTLPRRRLTIRNLLNVTPVVSGSVEYPSQKTRNNNAAPVAEGAAKPESDLQFELKTAPIRTVAHWTKASRQVLDDAPQLSSIIDEELRYGLALVEETQLLYGDGTGQNLTGMAALATAFASPITPPDVTQEIDVIGQAILQAALTNTPPDGIILHPGDWWRMRLAKDSTGEYILGDPAAADKAPFLWGLPVVPTQAITARKFMVGSFKSQTLYDRMEPRVEVGFVNDDFTRNLVTLLGEERVGLAAKVPTALIYGDFDTALAA